MIVFVKTRHHYGSYTDFWSLVDLSGFDSVFIDEVDLSLPAAYIFTPMNGEVKAFLENHGNDDRRCMLIWWFLERLDDRAVIASGEMDRFAELFDAIWISCRHMASMHPAFKHVILGSHPNLGNDPGPIVYHYTHQSCSTHRRDRVYAKMRSLGLAEGPNAWGDKRDSVLRSSASMVHVQQFEGPFYTPLRFALAAAYALPLVSETLADPYPLEFIDQGSLAELPQIVRRIADDPGDKGTRLFETLCLKHTFRAEVEKAL